MARASFAISNFTAGELSPQLDGRTDLGKYFNGAKTLENWRGRKQPEKMNGKT